MIKIDNLEVLTTRRKKTLNFYNKYKNFDFEDVNEMLIDLFENIINNISGEMTNSLTKELISSFKEQSQQILELKKDIDILKSNIIIKMHDIKNENIDNIRLLLIKNDNENIIKIIEKIENENKKLIEEVIPKNNVLYYEQYNSLMSLFKEEMLTKNLNQYENLEFKYNNLLKNIEISLNNSELMKKMNDISELKQHEMINVNNNIANTELRLQNTIKDKNNDMKDTISSLINYITRSEERITNNIKEINNTKSELLINYITSTDEQIKKNIIELKMNNEIQHNTNLEMVQKLNEHLDKYNNSSKKGHISENYIENLLNSIYKSADIKRTTDKSKCGDFIMKNSQSNLEILFEIKNYNRNVPSIEVEKFERDLNERKLNGIMLSISSGICNKYNYQIDITNNNNICLYIHDVNFDPDKIKLGVDIIENLYSKIKINDLNDDQHIISNDTLNNINKEYQNFIIKRDKLITHIKESSKISIQQIEEIVLSNLNNLLTSKYSFNNTCILECDICKNYTALNLKTLATHKSKCILREHDSIEESNHLNDESYDNKLYMKRRNDILYRVNNKKLTVKEKTLQKYKIIFDNDKNLYI